MNTLNRQRGMTLVEVSFVIVIVGILFAGISVAVKSRWGDQTRAYNEKHRMINERAVMTMKGFASDNNFANLGIVPSPYTGGGYVSTLYNPADTSATGLQLATAYSDSMILQKEINDDGTALPKIRAYQLVSNLVSLTTIEGPGSALATLRYQFGAVYQTACPKGKVGCAPNPVTGMPGASPALTAANFATWKTTGTDGAAITFSTLNLQKQMLGETVQRMHRIQDAFGRHFNALMIKTAAGDATNHYPSGTTSMAGLDPLSAAGQGCRDGWYPLNSGSILGTIGLSIQEYGTTTWGAPIEFCRDYDPTGTKQPNATPHYAAIRIHKDVSSRLSPDASTQGNNIILTL